MIPAFVNDAAGTAAAAKRALEEAGGFEIHATEPDKLESAMRDSIATGPRRIVVAGGDGSVATAAGMLAGKEIELAVLPGGTLNHFARDHDIPTDLALAANVALNGQASTADVGYVGQRLFLNTSTVGAYVVYVRLRNRLKKYFGYRIASLLAALRLFYSLHPVEVELDVAGERKRYSTPLVFVGVGERETRSPTLGNRVRGGRRCLHVVVVRERRAARILVLALDAAMQGLHSISRTPELDSFMVDSCTIRMKRRHHIAIDGEIVAGDDTLEYRLEKDALRIVVPDAARGDAT
ncbi:MAG: diacylglycerol kinase family protein [Gemmatimonadaceae bacterium]